MNTLKLLRSGALLLLFIAAQATRAESVPDDQPLPMPTYGFNLGNTLEATPTEGNWGPVATKAVIDSIAAEGFNAIRIPVSWDIHADPSTHAINPVWMARVKQVVDWALDTGMYVVLNDHWDGGWLDKGLDPDPAKRVDPAIINEKMDAYWTQIATTFADYDNRLLFAGANEPGVANPTIMKMLLEFYQTFVNAVRATGGNNTNRWLVLPSVSPPSWMTDLPTDSTPHRLMVEYHSYMPTLFTIIHGDQSWGQAIYYWGAAYHYDGDPSRNHTWYGEDMIDFELQTLADTYVNKGIPVLIGEFGAYRTDTLSGTKAEYNRASTIYWNKYVAESARAKGISPFFWSIQFNEFDWTTGAVTNQPVIDSVTGKAAPPPPNGAPYAVTGLTATNTGVGQIDLAWNAVDGATSYNIHRGGGSGLPAATTPFATGVTGTTYTDSGLNDGTTYYYQVVAVNASGPSGFTAEAHATTPGLNPDPTQFHFEADTQRWMSGGGQITSVAVSTEKSYAGNRSLAVNFNGASGGTSTLTLDRAAGVPSGTTITFHVWIPAGSKITRVEAWLQDFNWSSTQTSFNNLTADAWNTLTWTLPENSIAPFVGFGLRFVTNAAWTGTCYVDSISWESQELPSAPMGLAATAGAAKVALNWTETAKATSYTVMRSTKAGSDYATIATTDAANYTDTGLASDTTFYYVVTAENEFGGSVASAVASATPSQSLEDWRMEHFNTSENTGDAADSADPDKDGRTNWQEFASGTDPNDPKSFLTIERPAASGSDLVVRFPTTQGRIYRLEKSDTLLPDSWLTVQDNIGGTGSTLEITDAGAANADHRFYRAVITP